MEEMHENGVGNCRICTSLIMVDEEYHMLGDTLLEGIVCKDCNTIVDEFCNTDISHKVYFDKK